MEHAIRFGNLDAMDYNGREAMNSLRTNLQFSGGDLKVFLITSSLPAEGKSTISFDLARSMAEEEKRVVYVDADLRKSTFIGRYKLFSKDKHIMGLSHYLSKQAKQEDILYETNLPGLYTIMTGPLSPNPTELLGSQLFIELLKNLRENFDAVIIDSPPLGAVIDAAVMAPYCDGAVLIIESEVISRRLLTDVKKQLEVTGCRILGTVLNKVDMTDKRYYSQYYKEYKKEK